MASCDVCQGSGTLVCVKCRGRGRVGRSGEGICSDCEGSGVVECSNCRSEPEPQVRATSVRPRVRHIQE